MPIFVWEQHIDQVEEKKCLHITNASIKIYLTSKLSTTKNTVIPFSDDLAKKMLIGLWFKCTNLLHVRIFCPEIVSVAINIFPVRSNLKCNKKVDAPPVEKLTTCLSCGRRMFVSKLKCGFTG